MSKCRKWCIKRLLKSVDENLIEKPFTIIDAYNKKVYDTPEKAQRIINAQNAAHVCTQWKFVLFEIEIDERHSHLAYDPENPACNFIQAPKTLTGNRTTQIKNKLREEAEKARKKDIRDKAQREFEAKEKALMAKMTPEQLAAYMQLKLNEGK